MNTDWLFDGIIDAEQKQYVLLSYFQKLNKKLEEMKVYPMFTEISLHLGNIQTLMNQNKILYSERKLKSYDDELLLTDLKLKDIPVLAEDEFEEYQKILKNSFPQIQDYFGIAKSFWSIVYDSIQINVKKNKSNINSSVGFFYYVTKDFRYVWKYTKRKVKGSKVLSKTSIKLIHKESPSDLTIQEIISNFLITQNKPKNHKLPIFEIICNEMFPLEETLIPIFKRKIMAYIVQSLRNEKSKKQKLLTDGVQ